MMDEGMDGSDGQTRQTDKRSERARVFTIRDRAGAEKEGRRGISAHEPRRVLSLSLSLALRCLASRRDATRRDTTLRFEKKSSATRGGTGRDETRREAGATVARLESLGPRPKLSRVKIRIRDSVRAPSPLGKKATAKDSSAASSFPLSSSSSSSLLFFFYFFTRASPLFFHAQ